ncbi:MAG TPA: cell division protein FtsL [Pyrinomonadaceae bacterium]|jgi:cell division protein FtsL
MRRIPTNQPNTRIRRERDPRALSRLALLLFSALVLAGGFVFAARQHFAAVQHGYDSEALRKEREQLVREEQQLLLEKEKASSPARLESAARTLGLRPLAAGQVAKRKTNKPADRVETMPTTASAAVATTR